MNQREQNGLTLIGSVLLVGLLTLHYALDAGEPVAKADLADVPALANPAVPVPQSLGFDGALDEELAARTSSDINDLSDELAELLDRNEFRRVNERLLRMAAGAVESGDQATPGAALSLLGQVAIEEQDFDSAEVYLLESLDVYERLRDAVGAAETNMQLGRMHVKLRHRARTAGHAYDRVLLARWQLSEGQFEAAEQNLRLVVDENLSINRFGAAASAFRSLIRLYTEAGHSHEAQQAAMEAAELYAAAGQIDTARSVVAGLERSGAEDWSLVDIEEKIDVRFEEFRDSVEQIGRAEDYQRLYNYYRAQGDEERAWSLRVQASASLRNVSKRAMFRRIPDVLALLYVSNDYMARPEIYLKRAARVFDDRGNEDLLSKTRRLEGQIL